MVLFFLGILTNGKGTRREYGQFNLDELGMFSFLSFILYFKKGQTVHRSEVIDKCRS